MPTITKQCSYCSLAYETNFSKSKYCKRQHTATCEVCKTEFPFKLVDAKRIPRTCSSACASALSHTPAAEAKRRENSLAKWGTETPLQAEAVKKKIAANPKVQEGRIGGEKFKAAMLEKYGVENYGQRRAELMRGAQNPMASEAAKEKLRATMLERYGVEHALQVPEFHKQAQETYRERVEAGLLAPPGRISNLNRRWAKLLEETYGCEVELEKTLAGHCFDLWLPESQVAVELNPTISHNSLLAYACVRASCPQPCEKHPPLSRTYHFAKAKDAQAAGLKLVQGYSWDAEERLLAFLGGKVAPAAHKLSARKLSCHRLKQAAANSFLQRYHFQGSAKGQSHCYGLFTPEGEPVAVATFGRPRFAAGKFAYEFIRYAVKDGYVLHGGAGKLFREFLRETGAPSVNSYVNFDHTTAATFLPALGFQEVAPTGPTLVWSKLSQPEKRVTQTAVNRLGADRLLGTTYGPREASGLDNEGILLAEGYVPVWTAGNRVFEWYRP